MNKFWKSSVFLTEKG